MSTTPNNITRTQNHIGSDYSGSANFYNGGFLEIMAYNNFLGSQDIGQGNVEAYLFSRYQPFNAVPGSPIISVGTSALNGPTQVAIAAPPDCVVKYTTDGSTPGISSPTYNGPIQVYYSLTLQAIAVKNGVSSSVTSATYTLDSNQWPAPDPSDTTQLQINVQSPTN